MHNQLIYIGLPVYNGGKFLRHALDALLAQTHRNFCLIISDNASSDDTEAICRAYAQRDARIAYFRQPANLGAVGNFQFTLDQAQGDFFMWAAHDDDWHPRFLEKALILLDDPSVGFVFPSFRLKSIRLGLSRKMLSSIFQCIEMPERDQRMLAFCNLHHSSHKCNLVYSVFRRTILSEALTLQDVSDDGLLSLVILSKARGALLPETMFAKRYEYLWPGFRRKLRIKPAKLARFAHMRDASFARARALFPELVTELERIRTQYQYQNGSRSYRIIENFPEQERHA